MSTPRERSPSASGEMPVVDRSHLLAVTGAQRLTAGLGLLIALMNRSERLSALVLLASMLLNGALNILAVSSVMPFVYLVIADDPINGSAIPARVFRYLGLENAHAALYTFGLLVVVLAAAKAAYAIFHARTLDSFSSRLEVRMATKLLRRITEAPYQWLTTKNGTVLREIALSRTSEWARVSVRMLMQLVGDVLFLLLSMSIIIAASPKEGLAVIVSAGLLSLLLLRICKVRLLRYADEKRRFSRSALLSATDAIMGGRDVRISRSGRLLVESFRTEQSRFGVALVKGRLFGTLPRHVSEVIGVCALVALGLSMLASGIPKSEVSAILILYALILIRALPVLSQVLATIATLYSLFPAVTELNEFVDEVARFSPEIDQAPLKATAEWQKLELRGVDFRYPEAAEPALKEVGLTFRRGERIGVVGASGAGKSTLIDILVGLLHPDHGGVYIDSVLLTGRLERAWQAQIGYVTQSPFLVDGTLLDNVVLGVGDTTQRVERCVAALHSAGLKPLLDSLPDGIYSRSGDFGGKLSGGQRQRVAIARALYRRASCLVLDEATSALDSVTERAVMDGIFELPGEVAVIIIAHRLSLVQRCDRIAVLDKGQIVAFGNHADLLEKSVIYRNLVVAQTIDE